jgi:hypothetical protein
MAMKNKLERTLSRREFAQRAAMLSATASLLPTEVVRASTPQVSEPPVSEDGPKLAPASQAEADSRYQQIIALYGDRFDDAQKANLKRMCAELQPSIERVRTFKLENGDAPALYLKPLVERDRHAQTVSSFTAGKSPAKP